MVSGFSVCDGPLRVIKLDVGGKATLEGFHDIVGADTSPVFAGKVAIGQRLFNAVFYLICSLKKAYVHIEDWRNRPLQGGRYPYVYVDGIYLRRNWGGEYENAGHVERNIARGSGKVSAVVTAAVPLASLISQTEEKCSSLSLN